MDSPELKCPSCGGQLFHETGWVCRTESIVFDVRNGIPDLLLPSRREAIEQFLRVYQNVRHDERWGSESTDYYRALPWNDLSGRHKSIWRMRAAAFTALRDDLRQRGAGKSLRILDAGAGNCWLAMNLVHDRHLVTAVDVNLDASDGLGVLGRFPTNEVANIFPVRAEFSNLPFGRREFDVIVFNASLHYSRSPTETLSYAGRFLKDDGVMYVMDSPIYSDASSGERMVLERTVDITRRFSMHIPVEFAGGYLTDAMLQQLSGTNTVRVIRVHRTLLSPICHRIKRLLLGREPALMNLIAIEPRRAIPC